MLVLEASVLRAPHPGGTFDFRIELSDHRDSINTTMSPKSIPASPLLDALRWRYATKAFDANRKISADVWSALEECLVL